MADLTAFNPQIAALATPQSGVFSEAGKALMGLSDRLSQERLRKKQEQALEQEHALKEQQYHFNAALNPLKIEAQQSENKNRATEEAHRASLRPFDIENAKLGNQAKNLANQTADFQLREAKDNQATESLQGLFVGYAPEEATTLYKGLVGEIMNDPKLNLKQKLERSKIYNKAYAAYQAARSKTGGDSLSAEGLFESVKDDPYVAGFYDALNDDGSINPSKLKEAIKNDLAINGRATLTALHKLRGDKNMMSDKAAEAFKGLEELKSSLEAASDGGKKVAGDYMGLWDASANTLKTWLNSDEGKIAFGRMVDTLKHIYVSNKMIGKAESERASIMKEVDVDPNAFIATGANKSALQNLINRALDFQKSKIESYAHKTRNSYLLQQANQKITELEKLRSGMLRFAEAPTQEVKRGGETIAWQDVTPSNQPKAPASSAPLPPPPAKKHLSEEELMKRVGAFEK